MKKCPSCTKELPDSALVCVFCRAQQPGAPGAPSAQGGPSPAKTMMGYAAVTGDLLKGVGAQPPAPAPAPAPAPPPAQPPAQFGATMMVPPGGLPAGHPGHQPQGAPYGQPPMAQPKADLGNAATMMVAPGALPAAASAQGLPRAPSAPPPQGQPYAQPPQGQPYAQPPMGQPYAQPPMGQPYAQPPQGQPYAQPPMGQPYAQPPMGQPYPPPSGGMPPMAQPRPASAQPYPPGAAGMPALHQPPPSAMQGTPLAVPASAMPSSGAPWQNAETRVPGGEDPFLPSIRRILRVMGIVLLVTCVVPWELSPRLHFSWDMLANARGMSQQLPIIGLFLAMLLAMVFAFVPAGSGVRGLFAFLGGGTLLGCYAGTMMAEEPNLGGQGWRLALLVTAWLLGPAAMVLRGRYRESVPARAIATLAVLCHLAVFLIPMSGPMGDSMVPLVGLFKGFAGPSESKAISAIGVVIFVAGILPLTAWMSVRVKGFGTWPMLTLPGLGIIAALVYQASQHGSEEALFRNPGLLFVGVWLFAASVLFAYGLAALLAKLHRPGSATA